MNGTTVSISDYFSDLWNNSTINDSQSDKAGNETRLEGHSQDFTSYPEYIIKQNLLKFVDPTLFFLAIVGNALAVAVFAQKSLRSSVASQLYIILAVVDGTTVVVLYIPNIPQMNY